MFRFQSLSLTGSFDSSPAVGGSHRTTAEFRQSTNVGVPFLWGQSNSQFLRFDQDFVSPSPASEAAANTDAPPRYEAIHPNRVELRKTDVYADRSILGKTVNYSVDRKVSPAFGPHDTTVFRAAVEANGKLNSWGSETSLTGVVNGASSGFIALGIAKVAAVAALGPVLGGIVVVGGGSAAIQALHIWGVQDDATYFDDLTDVLRSAIENGLVATIKIERIQALRKKAQTDNTKKMFNDFSRTLMAEFPDLPVEFYAALAKV